MYVNQKAVVVLYPISFVEEEYKNLVEKYATIREDFQTKMVGSCTVSIDKKVVNDTKY